MRMRDACGVGVLLLTVATALLGCRETSASSTTPTASDAGGSSLASLAETSPTGRWCGSPADALRLAPTDAPKVEGCPQDVDGARRPESGAGALALFPAKGRGIYQPGVSTRATDAAGEARCCYDWHMDARPAR
jgi:hypothetical protein